MILLTLLVLLFLLVIINIWSQNTEGFENEQLSPTFLQSYKKFADFYNSFLTNWEKAIVTAVSLEIPQEPLSSPTQTSSAKPPNISRLQQNNYISKLSNQMNMSLPFITDPLPSTIDSNSIPTLLTIVPKDSTPFQNALTWMNNQMKLSQINVNNSLQGIPPVIEEGFANSCGSVSSCLVNNQEFISKVSDEVFSKQAQKQKKQQDDLMNRMNAFQVNNTLQQSLKTNQELTKQTEELKKQAESGDLYKKVNINDEDVAIAPMPAGGTALENMKQTNPQQYNQLKDNYSQLFSLKQLIEQINRNI